MLPFRVFSANLFQQPQTWLPRYGKVVHTWGARDGACVTTEGHSIILQVALRA